MIKFHWANHRIELAVKDVLKDSAFSEVDKQYLAIFNLMKNLCAVKSDVKSAAKALDILCYTLPKITRTCFVSHRKKAYTRLLNMWPALITALENTIAYRKNKRMEKVEKPCKSKPREAAYHEVTSVEIWEKLLKYQKQTFLNMCILAELILSLAGFNSAVECGFS